MVSTCLGLELGASLAVELAVSLLVDASLGVPVLPAVVGVKMSTWVVGVERFSVNCSLCQFLHPHFTVCHFSYSADPTYIY